VDPLKLGPKQVSKGVKWVTRKRGHQGVFCCCADEGSKLKVAVDLEVFFFTCDAGGSTDQFAKHPLNEDGCALTTLIRYATSHTGLVST